MSFKFGKNYPAMCPPEKAGAIEGEFYRFCVSNEPHADDFKTHYELDKVPRGKECEARALSFFDDLTFANDLKRKFKSFKNKTVIPIQINSSHGVGILENHHLNLWEFSNVSFIKAKENTNGGE